MKKIAIALVINYGLAILLAGIFYFLLLFEKIKLTNKEQENYFICLFNLFYIALYYTFSIFLKKIDIIKIFNKNSIVLFFYSFISSIILFLIIHTLGEITYGYVYFPIKIDSSIIELITPIILSASYEELFFRGYLLCLLKIILGEFNASVFVSVIFYMAHLPPSINILDFFCYFTFSMLLCSISLEFRSLLPCIIFHFMWNYGIEISNKMRFLNPVVDMFFIGEINSYRIFIFFEFIFFMFCATFFGLRRK